MCKAQARECLFEKLELQSRDKRDVDISLDLAQEAAQVNISTHYFPQLSFYNSQDWLTQNNIQPIL